MANAEINKSRIELIRKVSTIACDEYTNDSNRTNLDIVLSLYLEFKELEVEVPKCLDDIITNSLKTGDVVNSLKVRRGREMDLDEQFKILTCLLIIQTMEGKSTLNKYNKNGLSLEACMEKTATDCDTTVSNVHKCRKKYGNTFKSYIYLAEPAISFIFNKNTKEESLITLKHAKEPITEMIKEAINILF